MDDVARKFRRNFDAQPIVVRAGNRIERDEGSRSVHMALHDVAAESSIHSHGKFEVYLRTLLDSRERCSFPGLVGQIELYRTRRDFYRGQAHSADRDAVTLLELFGEIS